MPTEIIADKALEQLKPCLVALSDKKALELKVLNVRGMSTVCDYLVIASGNSETHLRALSSTVEATLKGMKDLSVASESGPDSGWVVVDAFDFMIHLFIPETRERYRLDQLWKDAEILAIDWL